MLAGRPAFNGRTIVEILHATLSRTATRADRFSRGGGARPGDPACSVKTASDRYPSAEAMADALRSITVDRQLAVDDGARD